MKTLLVTGFESFGGMGFNPTEALAREVDGLEVNGFRVTAEVLPVTFDEGLAAAVAAMDRVRPDVVLGLGLAAGRFEITPERIAINVRSTRDSRPDNAGNAPLDEPITDGPDGLFATLPVRAIVDALLAAGLPAKLSNTAGTYVCNTVMYGVLDHLRRSGAAVPAGFVHVPATPEIGLGDDMPTATMDDLREALGIILGVITRPSA